MEESPLSSAETTSSSSLSSSDLFMLVEKDESPSDEEQVQRNGRSHLLLSKQSMNHVLHAVFKGDQGLIQQCKRLMEQAGQEITTVHGDVKQDDGTGRLVINSKARDVEAAVEVDNEHLNEIRKEDPSRSTQIARDIKEAKRRMHESYQAKVDELKRDHSEEIARLREDASARLIAARRQFQEETATARRTARDELNEAKDTISDLSISLGQTRQLYMQLTSEMTAMIHMNQTQTVEIGILQQQKNDIIRHFHQELSRKEQEVSVINLQWATKHAELSLQLEQAEEQREIFARNSDNAQEVLAFERRCTFELNSLRDRMQNEIEYFREEKTKMEREFFALKQMLNMPQDTNVPDEMEKIAADDTANEDLQNPEMSCSGGTM